MTNPTKPPRPFEIVITQAAEITDFKYPTASWYDLHQLIPGTYTGTYPDSTGIARATLDTTLLKAYRVNRAFNTHSVDETTRNIPGTYTFHLYPWEVRDGREVLGGRGYIRFLDAQDKSA